MKGNCLIYLVIFIIIGIILLKSNVLYKSSNILEKFIAGAARWQRRRAHRRRTNDCNGN